MIRTGWTRQTALAVVAVMAAGCASSASRMPPSGPAAFPGAGPAYAPAPVYAPAPAYAEPAPYAPPVTPVAGVASDPWGTPAMDAPAPTRGITGLTERQPDLCSASTYNSAIGQPGSAIPSLGVTRTYRVVEHRGIEPQDYDPNRIVFRLDANGTITNIDCG